MTKRKTKTRAVSVPAACYVELPAPPTFRSSWPLFAFLIVMAVALYYAKWPILIIAGFILFVRGVAWFGWRFPKTTCFLIGFSRGLMGRRW